jgi:predicted ArsR family transcriptional regulator
VGERDLQMQARVLGDPTRFRMYSFIADSPVPVGVAEITEHVGLNHNAVRQHLAKMVESGLLVETTEARTAPGRPRWLYRVDPGSEERWRDGGPYRSLSILLVEMVSTGRSALEVGRSAGRRIVVRPDVTDDVSILQEAIERGGFDPSLRRVHGSVEFVLRTCPFADAAEMDPDVVCELHLGLAEGIAEQLDGVTVDELVRADPRRAGCRLKFHTTGAMPRSMSAGPTG